ncbi:oligosaccharide flippase family protein [Tenacibaculum singaporense]|uniref:oligosaccharide flippase family protein n=1 Tax=Tenacibaculum singaporense TaxID=2358479 RepID=UPI0013DDEAB8|nr:oligosaccharide flippase family protein [Tenacibaculum singaporense]
MKYFLNTIYLYLAQGINLIFPILIYPFLIDKISLEGFGIIILLQVIMNYGTTLVDYGYNLIGTNEVSNSKSYENLASIVSKVLVVKFILLVLSFLMVFVSVFFIKPLQGKCEIVFLGWLNVVGIGLYPIWYFQGKEEMQLIGIINLVSKLVTIVGILLFIKGADDINLTVFFLSLSSVLCALFSWIYIYVRDKLRFSLPTPLEVISDLRIGFSIFLSNILVQLYSNFVLIISTGMLNTVEIGILGVYLKLRDVFVSVIGPIQQAVYPELSKLINSKLVKKTRELIRKTLFVLFSISIITSLGYYAFFDYINKLLFENNAEVLDMLAFLCILLIAPYGGLITRVLVANKKNKFVFLSTFFSGLFALVTSHIMVYKFSLKGALYVIFFSYLLNVVMGSYFLIKKKL